MNDEALTEAVGNTQAAAQSTERAWSDVEEWPEWRMPTEHWRLGKSTARKVATRALPAVGVAGAILAFALSGHPAPAAHMPAPPSAAMPTVNPAPGPDAAKDDQFIRLNADAGLALDSLKKSIEGAHWVCTYISDGHAPEAIVKLWDAQTKRGEDPAVEHRYNQAYVNNAITVYCPQYGAG